MRVFIRSVVSTLVAVGAVVAADAAHASVSGACTSDALDCSSGTATLHAESREAIMSSIGTGWLPACETPDANGHCAEQPIQVSASVDLAALPQSPNEPLWMVDMGRGAVVDARWPSKDEFELTVPTATTPEGTFKVTHTLIPQMRVHAQLLGASADWVYDASGYLPESYDYVASHTISFLPWAMDELAINLVPAPSVETTTLLQTKIINDANNDVDIALAAKTSPTFVYRTTKVSLGDATAITTEQAVGRLPMVDADFLDLVANVEGEIDVEGELIAAPYVKINKIAGFNVPMNLGLLDLSGALDMPSKAYNAAPAAKVTFAPVTVHVPLPNLKVPATAVDLGSVQVGRSGDGAATITNTGELGGAMSFQSSDPQFVVVDAALVDAKTDYALVVKFTPTSEGAQSATITMTSNDPDSPEQVFEVHANGTPEPVAPPSAVEEPDDGDFVPAADDGCGCRAAPAGTSYGGLAGLGLAGLLVVRRRRRQARI